MYKNITIQGNDVWAANEQGEPCIIGQVQKAVNFNGKSWSYRYGYNGNYEYVRIIASTRQALLNKLKQHYNQQ